MEEHVHSRLSSGCTGVALLKLVFVLRRGSGREKALTILTLMPFRVFLRFFVWIQLVCRRLAQGPLDRGEARMNLRKAWPLAGIQGIIPPYPRRSKSSDRSEEQTPA